MKLSESQQKALDIVQNLIKEGKIELNDAFALITAIAETEKEYVYIPSTQPWVTEPYTYPSYPGTTPATPWWPNQPWYNQNTITCNKSKPTDAFHATLTDFSNIFDGWQGTMTH